MKNSKLDEMQEMKLLEIEHRCCWMAIWGLVAVILFQGFLSKNGAFNTLGESVVLAVICIYQTIACIKNGIWDRKFQPKFSTNLGISLAAGVVMGGGWFAVSYYRYHALAGSIATFVVMMLSVTIFSQILLTLCSTAYHRRKAKLDAKADREESGD